MFTLNRLLVVAGSRKRKMRSEKMAFSHLLLLLSISVFPAGSFFSSSSSLLKSNRLPFCLLFLVAGAILINLQRLLASQFTLADLISSGR